jgi:hypothetical protein
MQPIPTRIFAVTSALLLSVATPARGQGFVVATPDSSARITFGGRVQTIFNTTSVDDEPATETELRRVRLEANLQLGRIVGGRIQPEFAGSRVSLRDAYVRFTLDPALQIWAGQAHRPFGVISPSSTTRFPTAEKGLRIRGVGDAVEHFNLLSGLGYSDRDVGLQLRGEPSGAPLGLSYAAGIFNGPARADAPEENTWQGVARLAIRPVDNVRVGVSYSRIDFAQTDPDTEQLFMAEGAAWEADLELGSERGGPRALVEVARGDSDPFPAAEFVSAAGFVAYRTGRQSSTLAAIEPFVRVSWADPDVDEDALELPVGGTLVTPGINLWLGGLNRLGLFYDLWNPDTGERARSFKALFQLAF